MEFKYKSNDWKEICDFIDQYFYEHSRTKSNKDNTKGDK